MKQQYVVSVGYHTKVAFDTPEDAADLMKSLLRGSPCNESFLNGTSVMIVANESTPDATVRQQVVYLDNAEADSVTALNLNYWVNRRRFVSKSSSVSVKDIRTNANIPDDHDLFLRAEHGGDDTLIKNEPYKSIQILDGMDFYSAPQQI